MKFGKNADGKFPHHIFWKEANMPTAKMFRYEHTEARVQRSIPIGQKPHPLSTQMLCARCPSNITNRKISRMAILKNGV